MTGGGTMWININSSIIPDVEQLLGALLPPHQGYTSKSELSIPAEIKKLAAKVAENAKDIDFMGKDNGMNVAYCHKYLKQLSDQYQKFGPVLKAAQPSHQRAIKEFLARAVSIATNSLNPE